MELYLIIVAMACKFRVRIPVGARDFSLLQTLRPTGSGVQSASYSLFRGDKATGAWS
jgi:hypothetical protein